MLAVFVAAYCLFLLLFASPYISYQLKSPKGTEECGKIKPGLSVSEAEEALRSKTEPHELRLTSGQLVSVREDGSCSLQLDPNKTVTGEKFDAGARWSESWPDR